MTDALGNSQLGHLLVLEVAEGEGQGGKLLVDLRQQVPGVLHFEAVVGLHVSFEYGRAQRAGSGLAVSCAYGDVNRVDLGLFEFARVDSFLPLVDLVRRGIPQRHLLHPVDDESLHLMHPHGGDGVDAVGVRDSAHGRGYLRVFDARLDGGRGDEHGLVSRHGYVAGLFVNHEGSIGVFIGYDEGVGGDGDVAVNVASQVNLDDVAWLEDLLLLLNSWIGLLLCLLQGRVAVAYATLEFRQ